MVSVVVPTRDSGRTLDACLRSIRSQTYRPLEIILVDNHSIDQTLEVAQRYADIVDIAGPERSAQRNRGALLAHGDYLLFIDSDMTLQPAVINDCVNAVNSSGAPAVIIPEVSVGEGFWARARALERSSYIGDDAIEAARFFPRAVFEKSGGFDESLVAMEDWDLSRRVAAGVRLPRTASRIEHDEGRLRLSKAMAKKRYYAAASRTYLRKHGRSALGQGSLIFRPAFLRNWRQMLRHPLLATGVMVLKSTETVGATWGLLEGLNRGQRDGAPSP